MKDSTAILVVAAILAAAVLPAVGTSMRQVAKAADMIEQIRAAAQAPSGIHAMVSSNRTVRLHSDGRNFMKGWFSL
jgi:type II secretory pathway pseudopilin PulG